MCELRPRLERQRLFNRDDVFQSVHRPKKSGSAMCSPQNYVKADLRKSFPVIVNKKP